MAGHKGVSKRFVRGLTARDPAEHHRAATPLELLYDLVLVIAVAAAAAGLHHAIAEDHVAAGLFAFLFLFWSLWWPWVNFTWFASAFDNDDVVYRCLVFVQMVGALVTAVGIGQLSSGTLTVLPLAGYIMMRIGMISLWLRAARANPKGRTTALRYAVGIALCQVAWLVVFIASPRDWFMLAGLPVIVAEMAVPAFAESQGATPWHKHHIIERYGLLTIIVFGEALLAASAVIAEISREEHFNAELCSILVGGLLVLISMWWIYFGERYHTALDTLRGAFLWGYSHYFIFASATAVGAGIAIAADQVTRHAEISAVLANASVAVPAAIYLLSVWFAHDRRAAGKDHFGFQLPIFAALVLVTPLFGHGVLLTGLVLTICLIMRVREDARANAIK